MSHIISIITPTYNCESYIYACLESVRSQGLSDKVKHIVIDGGSKDETCNIIRSFANVDLVSESDDGQSDAFNKGIILAKGEWIMILDGDDILLPNSLSKYINLIEKKSPDIIYGHQCFINEDANIIKTNISVKYKKRYVQNHLYLPPSSGLCLRSSLIKNQLFDINHHYNMDTEWFLRYPGKISSGVIPTPTTGFRVWQGSKTYSLTSKYSSQAEDNISEEITKEREILDKKYYAPYRKHLSKKYTIYSKLIPKLIKVDYLINKVYMKTKYLIIKLIKGI
tara:strand:+ start:61 stop:903 length:843 start_codon:yes stop_codon:yes gene_type:complete